MRMSINSQTSKKEEAREILKCFAAGAESGRRGDTLFDYLLDLLVLIFRGLEYM